jgi:hypothetical protein
MKTEKILTKRIEKFVSNLKNPIFADRFLGKLSAFNQGVGDGTEKAINCIVKTCRKVSKYTYGKDRIKRFLINNINDFEKDHNYIVDVIEVGDVKDNLERYLACKGRISAILRANRRMNLLTDNTRMQSYINEYLTRQRFEKKYQQIST